MKISISAIGRLRKSPEKELIDDYLSRFSKLAKPFGLSLNPIIEIEDKKGGGPKTEAQLLERHFQKNQSARHTAATTCQKQWLHATAGCSGERPIQDSQAEHYCISGTWTSVSPTLLSGRKASISPSQLRSANV